MFKRVKTIAVILCIGLILGGCGNGTTVSNENVQTVTVWTGASHSKIVMDELVNKYNSSQGLKDGIKIEYIVKDGASLAQSLQLALQSGQAPDLFVGGTLDEMVENGYIVALEDLSGGEDIINRYDESLIAQYQYQGKTYAVPASVTTRALIYNKDMFKEAGIVDENGEPTPPETYDELREYAKKLTNVSKNQFGIILPIKWSSWFGSDISAGLQSSVGHSGFNPVTGKSEYYKMAPIMETFLGMKADNSVYPGAEGVDNDTARALFASGVIGMKFAFSFDVGVLNSQFPAECDWGVAPLPVLDKNEKYLQRMTTDRSFFINAASRETIGDEKLVKVFNFFISDDVMKELYKQGMQLPVDFSLVEGIKPGENLKGWSEFAEMLPISALPNTIPKSDMAGLQALSDRFINDVWSGNVSALQMLQNYDKDLTEGIERYYKNNANESIDAYLNSDWNIKITD